MKVKEEIMNANTRDDLIEIESKTMEQFRSNYYNQLLKSYEVKKHICEMFNVDEHVIQNALMINGYPPLDDFIDD